METQLVCRAFAPGTPNNPLDVLDLIISDGEIRLTIRREGKILLKEYWDDDEDGRSMAEAMMKQFSAYRPPTEEERQTVPDLQMPVESADPEDTYLCIEWDIDGRSTNAALGMRNEVLEIVENALDQADLLVEWAGASIGAGTVETTFSVVDFEAAKSLVWETLTDEQKAHNCRVFDEAVG